MLWEVGAEFVIPFYLEDNVGDDIVSGVVPYAIIRRISDNKYYNSSTGLWQNSSYSILLDHYFEGIWTHIFVPDQQDIYIIKCNEDIFKIRDGVALKTVSRLTLLDNLDTTVSSRLAGSGIIDTIDANVDTINLNVSDIKNTVDTNLDAMVSSRSVVTDESVWSYSVRTNTPENESGIGDYSLIINVTVDGVATEDIDVFVYNNDRIAINQAITDSSGQVVFYLDSGEFFIDFNKNGVWQKEVSQTINENTEIDVDMESIITSGFLGIEYRELNIPELEVGSSANVGIELYSIMGTNFSVSSGTAIITGTEEAVTCTIDGHKIYARLPVTELNWNYIVFTIVVGSETLKFELPRIYVD